MMTIPPLLLVADLLTLVEFPDAYFIGKRTWERSLLALGCLWVLPSSTKNGREKNLKDQQQLTLTGVAQKTPPIYLSAPLKCLAYLPQIPYFYPPNTVFL